MKAPRLHFLLVCLLLSPALFSQIDLKLQLMPDGQKFGVYAVPQPGVAPTSNTLTGSAQVTIVAPLGFQVANLQKIAGNWANNANIHGPIENPSKSYVSFGLLSDQPKIIYTADTPTLLFTFDKPAACPDTMYFIVNGVDPFDQLPNSANSNPGNELTIIDFGTIPFDFYNYANNIAPAAWNCHDCDNDGTPNALEDTNGDGLWTPGVDTSNLCDPDVAPCTGIAAATIRCLNDTLDCGYNPTGPISLQIDIDGGDSPYAVAYTNGVDTFLLLGYENGQVFEVAPTAGAVYTLVKITESGGCESDPASLSGEVEVTFDGSLSIGQHPAATVSCFGGTAQFVICAEAENTTFSLRWEYSNDLGASWWEVPTNDFLYQFSPVAGANSVCDTLVVTNTAGMHGRRFRAVLLAENLEPLASQSAVLSLEGPLSILDNPSDLTVCAGETAVFQAAFADPSGASQQRWQMSSDGGATWGDLPEGPTYQNVATTTLTIPVATGEHNNLFRLQVKTAQCGAVYSVPAKVTVEGPIEFLGQPAPVRVCKGGEACFTAFASVLNAGTVIYQWQVNDAGAWFNVQNGAGISGAQSAVLCLSNIDQPDGYQYRALARTSGCAEVVASEAAVLNVESPISFVSQPQPVVKCSGESVDFYAAAAMPNALDQDFAYRWQVSADGQNWDNLADDGNLSGTADFHLAIANTEGFSGKWFRLSGTGFCGTAYSEPASLVVEGPIHFSSKPENVVGCPDDNGSFTALASNLGAGSLSLQWQASPDGSNWADLTENEPTAAGGIYTGVHSNTLNISQLAGLDGFVYRLKINTGECEAFSTEATVTLEPAAVCDPVPLDFECVEMTLRMLPNQKGWGVYIRPGEDFVPTGYQLPTAGRVTVVAPYGFTFTELTSVAGGKWKPGKVWLNPPQNPGMEYIEFNLTPNQNFLNLEPGKEIMLFRFHKVLANCPDSLYLMDELVLPGFQPNEFAGFDTGWGEETLFHLCGLYDQNKYVCTPLNLAAPDFGDVAFGEEMVENLTTSHAQAIENEGIEISAPAFTLFPNPAGDQVSVKIEGLENRSNLTARLINAQGQTLRVFPLANAGTQQFDVAALVPGIYLLAFEADSGLLYRQLFVKK